MKTRSVILTAMAVVLSAAVSCTRFDDMNHNPYANYVVTSEQFVQPILFNTESSLMVTFYNIVGPLMQYSVSTNVEQSSKVVANYNIPESSDDDVWVGLYTQYGNAEYMAALAAKETNPAMLGVANVLKALIISQIADSYGNVPYTEAGQITLQGGDFKYTTRYDDMKSIYQDIFVLLESANAAFNDPKASDFSALCDYMYGGKIDKWQRFGNALYLRLLNRVAMKVVEEDGGTLTLSDGTDLNIVSKIAEMYDCYNSGNGTYRLFRGNEDDALVGFDENNSALQSPFYGTTSGNWGSGGRACETLAMAMNETTEGIKTSVTTGREWTYYSWAQGSKHDPRWDHYFHKAVGAPTQLIASDMNDFIASVLSSAGNSLVGRMPGTTVNSETGLRSKTTGAITSTLYPEKKLAFSNQNPDNLPLVSYSEQMFIFAEAGARGYLSVTYPDYRKMMLTAVTASVMYWRPDLSENDPEMVEFIDWTYSKMDVDNALETIMTQKWIASFFLGTEAWSDYRRTGYPILKTNGPAAENGQILPTRLRYPADEAYRNPVYYPEQVNGWLGGTNNMKTNVWWADTQESIAMRKKGIQ